MSGLDTSIITKRVLTDVHAHLSDPVFDADRAEVMDRARQAGVGVVVAVGETLEDARRNIALADQHPGILPAVGLYPTHLDLEQAEAVVSFIREHRSRLVAIGEVGFDHWKVQDREGRRLQRDIFGRFIDLSLELDLPLNVHSRSAGAEVVAFLLERGARRVLLHAFDGRPATAMPAVEAGYFFSIPPSVVRSRQKQKLVRRLPLSCLLLETDSPVLGPEPGLRNEPANIIISLRAVTEIKGLEEAIVREAVEQNTRRLFGKMPV